MKPRLPETIILNKLTPFPLFFWQVSFQICIDAVTKKKRACNIACKRSLLRGKIESVKGQVGYFIIVCFYNYFTIQDFFAFDILGCTLDCSYD